MTSMSESVTAPNRIDNAISQLKAGGFVLVMNDTITTPWGVMMCDAAYADADAVSSATRFDPISILCLPLIPSPPSRAPSVAHRVARVLS